MLHLLRQLSCPFCDFLLIHSRAGIENFAPLVLGWIFYLAGKFIR
jgi:hypothetical protein